MGDQPFMLYRHGWIYSADRRTIVSSGAVFSTEQILKGHLHEKVCVALLFKPTLCKMLKSPITCKHFLWDGILDLKHITELSVPLRHLFNLSLSSGKFPSKLKISRTVPIFKSGDRQLCDNYRPISLLSTISKILEKYVAKKLTNHLESNNLLYENQYGFLRDGPQPASTN
jgi:hypothetical protein